LHVMSKEKNVDVEDKMFIKDLKCRSLPLGKGEGGLGL